MNRNLFDLALEMMRPSDWEIFEELSSSFLASEFPDLRTMANPSGDGGRDSELFESDGVANVAIQYSVTKSWKTKIKSTAKRLKETFPDANVLIYMTNKVIGAKGDDIHIELLKDGFSLDIRDRSWFLDRLEKDAEKYGAAKAVIDRIATPYLEGHDVIEKKSPSLNSQEAKAALVYLGMQWVDENTDKGLTKVAYESLVRGALRGTHPENRLNRDEIYKNILSFLTSTDELEIKKFIDAALNRLTKVFIRHYQAQDEFCLTHDESERLKDKLVELESETIKFDLILVEYLIDAISECDVIDESEIDELLARTKRIIDRFLFKSGEEFASAVMEGSISYVDSGELKNVIIEDLRLHKASKKSSPILMELLIGCVKFIISDPRDVVRKHLRVLSDSYTIFAFLREVPDVQSATKKIFSYGNIWLDTTIILPLLAEGLVEEGEDRRYTNMFGALATSGVSLFVTEGAVREIVNHIRIAVQCAETAANQWQGKIPFLYFRYIECGYEPVKFKSWVELFRGLERPESDISDYLEQTFSIRTKSLEEEAQEVSDELRFAVRRLWDEMYAQRRSGSSVDGYEVSKASVLLDNDVESYLGVISLRKKEIASELGYQNWWLTLDGVAWKIRDNIRSEFGDDTPPSPLISIDFLSHQLSFGPCRNRIARADEQMLPVLLDFDLSEVMPKEILDVAEKVRSDNVGMPDIVIRRKVRDACDKYRRRCGAQTRDAINAA